MLTKATNHFKLPVTSNRATTTSRYIKVTSRPITFPQKTNSKTFPQKTNSQTFPQKTHSHMKHVSFPSTTNSKKVVNQQPKRRTDSNSGAIIFNRPITPQTSFSRPVSSRGSVFGQTNNPIPTRGADYAHHSATSPPGFPDLTTALFRLPGNIFCEKKITTLIL